MTLSQIFALAIFLVMFIVIIIGKVHRMIPALIGGALTLIIVFLVIERNPDLVVQTFSFAQLGQGHFWVPGKTIVEEGATGINWQTIIFIGGMMVMVEGLGAAGFFRWICLLVAKMVNYKVVPILVVFTILSGFLSMFIDSITVLLFLASITVELARTLKFDPVPVIIAEIFAANTGGSATMSGDPPNIIIGTALGLSFMDFVVNTGFIAWVGMVVCVLFFYFAFRKTLLASHQSAAKEVPEKYPQPKEAIKNRLLFYLVTAIFVLVIALLVTHAQTGISVALIGVIAAALTVITLARQFKHVMKGVDWRTLLFFIGLFITVAGLEQTGILKALAEYIGKVSGGQLSLVIAIILWVSAFASAIIDNIPFAATMVPVIRNLAGAMGASTLHPLAWTLALGTDIGGNATPIGASANVVGTAIADREGYPISWGRFCKYCVPSMILVVAICNILLYIRYV
jgi:Na+/H+ antiporter NhaD/arsenite permease-like protein